MVSQVTAGLETILEQRTPGGSNFTTGGIAWQYR
jgi:hypothetical protein